MAQDIDMVMDGQSAAALHSSVEAFGPKLDSETQQRLKDLGASTVAAMQAKVRGGRSRGAKGHHQSREQTAQGIAAKITTNKNTPGLEITSSTSHMAPGREAFPFAYNKPSWTHPVFGHGTTSQQGNPYFTQGTKDAADQAEKVFSDSLDKAADTIKGA